MFRYKKFSFFIFNFVSFFINIYFFAFKNKKELLANIMNIGKINLIINNFKNVDKFIFYIESKSYSNIANFINKNYNTKIDDNKIKKHKRRKLIKLYGVDLVGNTQSFKKRMKYLFKSKYIIRFDNKSPDYLFYNAFGIEHLQAKYKNAIKIAYLSENSIPDFLQCDYAIGHQNIIYFDRFFKFQDCFVGPLLNLKSININEIRKKNINNLKNKKFCAAVITNAHPSLSDLFRIKFIKELNQYKTVDSGGKYNNNVNGTVKNKTEFLSNYKFSIAMENTNGDGYFSEKIIDSFIAGSIPIYYGGYMIDEFINPKSYILIRGEKDIHEKIEYLIKIRVEQKDIKLNFLF